MIWAARYSIALAHGDDPTVACAKAASAVTEARKLDGGEVDDTVATTRGEMLMVMVQGRSEDALVVDE